MSVTIDVVFYDSNQAPLPGLFPTFAAPGFYKTQAGVAAAPPAVVDNGDGSYSFTLSPTDESTGVTYALDGGLTALSRFWFDSVDPTAASAPSTTIAPTGVNLFTVTPETLFRRHFSQWSAPSTESNPSFIAVAEIIDEKAGELDGKLLEQAILASALTVTNVPAYLWCRETLRLMCALQVASEAMQAPPPLATIWQKQLDARLADLASRGYLALGAGAPVPASDPHGPTTHIQHLNLDTGNPADASSARPIFRKDDHL